MNSKFAKEFKKALQMQEKMKKIVGVEFYKTKMYKEIRAKYKESLK